MALSSMRLRLFLEKLIISKGGKPTASQHRPLISAKDSHVHPESIRHIQEDVHALNSQAE